MMRFKNILFVLAMLGLVSIASCNSDKGTKFSPKEETSKLSDAERKEAITAKKSSLTVGIDSILNFKGVKFSIMPVSIGDGISQAASERLTAKLIGITAAAGIGGLTTNPVLGLVTKAERTESSLTGGAPQKTVVKYELTFYCGNFVSNEIYSSATVSLTGVGGDLESATSQAFGSLKDTSRIREMLKTGNDKAIEWYNNPGNLKMALDKAMGERNYALAMALLSSVPSTASTYEYAVKKNAEVSELFFQSKAEELYSKMKSAIAASADSYNPEAGACFALIPHNSKIWSEADKAFTAYCNKLDSDRRDAIARAQAMEDRDARNAYLLEMEKLQVEKVKAPYEAQATIASIDADARVAVAEAEAQGIANANTGGFLGLGKLWDGGFGIANRILNEWED